MHMLWLVRIRPDWRGDHSLVWTLVEAIVMTGSSFDIAIVATMIHLTLPLLMIHL